MRKKIGIDKWGNTYWDDPNGYVYQMLKDGTWNGWFCRKPSWHVFCGHGMSIREVNHENQENQEHRPVYCRCSGRGGAELRTDL